MSVSVSMPQLGESVTEGTVTRWLKKEGERVEADEPLLEVSTDKVDTEIPSPVSGVLRGITVAEDETVAVGAELAVIDEEGSAPGAAPADSTAGAGSVAAGSATAPGSSAAQDNGQSAAPAAPPAQGAPPYQPQAQGAPPYQPQAQAAPPYQPPSDQAPAAAEPVSQPLSYERPAVADVPQQAAPPQAPRRSRPRRRPSRSRSAGSPAGADDGQAADGDSPLASGTDGPYVTPLVRKLATEHGVDLGSVAGTGVGGRIRKQDVIDAARVLREPGAPAAAGQAPAAAPAAAAGRSGTGRRAGARRGTGRRAGARRADQPRADPGTGSRPDRWPGPAVVPSSLRGTTEHMSRARQVIAKRMVESLQTSAQLTTVVEADVTAIARLRQRAKADFEAREGVKLSFLPFFALAAVEALKTHPKLNAVIDTANAQVTYHDAEHLGIAVDTDRGLMVPVIRKAGDLNIGGLARKIADLAERTRSGRVSPDDLSGGTFTLTNTGSRGALFDTPIINQPQVAILGTGTVVKRPVVVEDDALGEVITVRSMVYLALTYDHRLVDGADAARFLVTMKSRLEEGAFETELGL